MTVRVGIDGIDGFRRNGRTCLRADLDRAEDGAQAVEAVAVTCSTRGCGCCRAAPQTRICADSAEEGTAMRHDTVGSVMTAASSAPSTARKSEKGIALSMTRRIDGVADVLDQLAYRVDDARIRVEEQTMHGVADDWPRRL
ncbi:hypothetical protein [Streptomyces sp. AK04-3B]|uniref:hypothetical protein n=1 Tax=Streptomyces sp. AK04-3B TaxID=3028650 RepID=UPI0029BB06E9|nr:hypothetical protein [Streptomyces sp. AK04-3B]MDX3797324.1 hypothetical protein [Streptomyces sp. AK04-3B]